MCSVADASADTRVTALIVRDCASRLRVDYLLPRPAGPDDFSGLARGGVHVDQFSQHSTGALDHFRFEVSPETLAHGVVGGRNLVVTYGKLGGDAGSGDRLAVERHLEALFGNILTTQSGQASGRR